MVKPSRGWFAAKRIVSAVPLVFGVVAATFLLTRLLPGDPAAFFTNTPGAGAAEIAEVRHNLGLDRSLPEQFVIYLVNLAHGDLGQSLISGQSVAADLMERLPASLELTVIAFVLACAVGLPLGIFAALRPGSIIDHTCRIVSTAGVSTPVFVSGLLLIYVFYYLLGWAPDPVGRLDPYLNAPPHLTGLLIVDGLLAGDLNSTLSSVKQLILPSATMALFALAPLARMMRGSMIAVLGSEFIRTARALGLPRRKIIMTYALRNALLPVITTLGMVFSYMLGANVLVEKVFAWPGIGAYALNALISLDYAPVQGFILLMACLYVVLNLMVDLIYSFIDPRVGLAE